MQIRTLILDWSGTLVNDLPPVFNAVNHVLATFDRPMLTLPEFRREFCLPVQKFYDSHLPGVSHARLSKVFFERFHQLQDEIVILPQTLEFLEFCRSEGLGLFIASTVDAASYQRLAREFGIDQYIAKAYLGIVDKTVMIHQIIAENQLVPAATMFVGDMEHDLEAGRAGGVRTCAVLTGYNPLEKLQAARPDLLCADLGQLQDRLATPRIIHGQNHH